MAFLSTNRRMVATAIALACIAVVFLGGLPDHLILFPSTNRIDPRGAIRRTVPFENGQLELWTAKSRAAQKSGRADVYVLRFYGNADRAERWVSAEADSWNERAIEIWGMNYPGFGGSSGPAKLARVGPAALIAPLVSDAGGWPPQEKAWYELLFPAAAAFHWPAARRTFGRLRCAGTTTRTRRSGVVV